jgi:hypothetical protein
LTVDETIRILPEEVQETEIVIDESKPFLCPQCAKGFAEEAAMKKHVILAHTTMSFLCHACQVRFDDRLALRQHQLAAHPKPPKEDAAAALESADDE